MRKPTLAQAGALVKGCLICCAPTTLIGLYIPDPEHEAELVAATGGGKRAGSTRCVTYGLCTQCAAIPGIETRAEEILFEGTA